MFGRACVIASALVCLTAVSASAQQNFGPRDRQWVRLGCYQIMTSSQEVGQIRVDSEVRRFSALRINSVGSNIRMEDLILSYGPGNIDRVPVRGMQVRPNEATTTIDLPGQSREVRFVEMTFVSTPIQPGPRAICVEGLGTRSNAQWEELGCHTVNYRDDLDVIRVGRDNLYRAIRLTVRDNDVHVRAITINYFGGTPETLELNQTLPRDGRSERINVRQDGQRMREIQLRYRSGPPGDSGRATVCVEGLVRTGGRPLPPPDMSQPAPGFKELGCHTVTAQGGTSEIRVGREAGRFIALQLRARDSDVRLQIIVVNLANGERKDFDVPRVRQGVPSELLSMGDRPHRINSVELRYRGSSQQGAGQAIVCLDGQVVEGSSGPGPNPEPRPDDRPDRPRAEWKELGCHTVNTRLERDIYRVGREEGRFVALRFRARQNDVDLRDITIRYNNGDPDHHEWRRLIRRDDQTSPLDLRGRRRAIQEIELTYRSTRGFDGAVLCIEGLEARSDAV